MEEAYELGQLRPTTELPPLPPLAGVTPGPVVRPLEVAPPVVAVSKSVDRDHDGQLSQGDVRAMVAPPPVYLGRVSDVTCECGQAMFVAREWPDGRTLYRCSCGKAMTF